MFILYLTVLLLTGLISSTLAAKCDQTPPQATVLTPSDDKGLFHLNIAHAAGDNGELTFVPSQTYVLTLEATNNTRPFRWFMITAEDPDVDDVIYNFRQNKVDVGTLKTLDQGLSRYSERCKSSVENYDNTEKNRVEIHWVSPVRTDKVRIRAMVAENSEVWYNGDNLTIILEKDAKPPLDSPPLELLETCPLCSEARYEVLFNGQWSRLAHPRHYPSKPDENGYTHMIGASHASNHTIWIQGAMASDGVKELTQGDGSRTLEREIIDSMSPTLGTRTLIRGKRRHHPHMFEPSHALFRVDRFHHQFSLIVGMRPSPDWFLGTNHFELCTNDNWLDHAKIPLYPWDAGTMDGDSYESPTSISQPKNNIGRVEVGSFNRNSPFYQMNLNDLKPFATLEVRRLDVYPMDDSECQENKDVTNTDEEEPAENEPQEDAPLLAESKLNVGGCDEWGEWSPCVPDVGGCGIGAMTRTRRRNSYHGYVVDNENDIQVKSDGSCPTDEELERMEKQHCFVEC